MKSFLERALAATKRGFIVTPLGDDTADDAKVPRLKGWQESATNNLEVIAEWAAKFPAANCGIVTNRLIDGGTWFMDVDDPKWFMDNFPFDFPETFTTKTGGGGYQFHFLHDDKSRSLLENKNLKNPNKKKDCTDKTIKENYFEIKTHHKQGVAPGSIHPATKVEYVAFRDSAVTVCSEQVLGWILGHLGNKAGVQKTSDQKSPWSVKPGLDIRQALAAAGLKWKETKRDGKVYLNYHTEMGKCLVKNALHTGSNNTNNNDCCAFVMDEAGTDLYHVCLAAACEATIQNKFVAIENLGLKIRDIWMRADDETWELVEKWGNSTVKKHLKFMWEPYLPSGKLAHFGGRSGEGKSPVTIDLMARVSAGIDWPDGSINIMGPRKVILLNIEDDWEDTILPRLELAGANLANCGYVAGTAHTKGDNYSEFMFNFDRDWQRLEKMIRKHNPAMVIIDPISNYLGPKLDMNKEADVRAMLTPVAKLAGELDFVPITVGHFNKREKGTDPLARMMGAAAFAGIARAVYVFGADPDEESEYHHVMTCARGSVGKGIGLKYHTEQVEATWDGQTSKIVVCKWDGVTTASAEETVDPVSKENKTDEISAAAVLKEFLKQGRKPAEACVQHLKQAGYDVCISSSGPGLNAGRVRRKAKAETKKGKGGKFEWFLKTAEQVGITFNPDAEDPGPKEDF